MQLHKIKRFELVELTINQNTPGRFNFVTQPQLRNQPDQIVIIKNIFVYPATVYSNSQQTGTVVGVPNAEVIKAALVLYVDGEESIKLIPLPQLIGTQDTANPAIFQNELQDFADLNNVAWEKSYVQFSVAAAGTPYVIPFGINYLRMKRNPNKRDINDGQPEWIDM